MTSSQPATQTSLPTFVDPSKIYDPHYDYERVKAKYNSKSADTTQSANSTPAELDQNSTVEQALVAALAPSAPQQTANGQPTADSSQTAQVSAQQEADVAQATSNLGNPSQSSQSHNPGNPEKATSRRKSGGYALLILVLTRSNTNGYYIVLEHRNA